MSAKKSIWQMWLGWVFYFIVCWLIDTDKLGGFYGWFERCGSRKHIQGASGSRCVMFPMQFEVD